MCYFFFKRSANGIIDFDILDYEGVDGVTDTNKSSSSSYASTRQCPKCNGKGRFNWDGQSFLSAAEMPQCDLCGGTGKLRGSSRRNRSSLPSETTRQILKD